MIWAKIKLNAIAILGGLLTISVFLLKIFFGRWQKAKKEAKEQKAKKEHVINVREKEQEHEAEFVSRSRELAKDLEDRGVSEELEDPNKW